MLFNTMWRSVEGKLDTLGFQIVSVLQSGVSLSRFNLNLEVAGDIFDGGELDAYPEADA